MRVTIFSLVLCGAVAAFLIFNIPAKFNRCFRCFMSDAGSTLLGFMLACLCISAPQLVDSAGSPACGSPGLRRSIFGLDVEDSTT